MALIFSLKRRRLSITLNNRLLILLLRDGDRALPEAVPEPPPDVGEVPHPAGAGGLPPSGLDGPAVLSCPGAGVAAVGARLLLDVERDLAAAAAQRVRLVAPLTERARTLRLEGGKRCLKYEYVEHEQELSIRRCLSTWDTALYRVVKRKLWG